MTGIFPSNPKEPVPCGPVSLVWCPDSGLLQMKQSYNPAIMYGDNYGYRSGLNESMVRHLQQKVAYLETIRSLDAESAVLDIGGNDGTLLKAYKTEGLRRFLVDPTAEKWLEHYAGTDLIVLPEFFTAEWTKKHGKADIITSIAMFYDLEDPKEFVLTIAKSLAPDGIWHFEQSYLPAMLHTNSYDTVCHEHLEYYNFGVVHRLLEHCGLRVLDVELNEINGGSFAVTACHKDSRLKSNTLAVESLLARENRVNWLASLRNFEIRVQSHRQKLRSLVQSINASGRVVAGLGASTKFNVVLQYCGFGPRDITFISDANPLKHGCFTPGTNIPIVSEELARAYKPDFMLVGPWHFRDGLIKREAKYLKDGGHLIFALPDITII